MINGECFKGAPIWPASGFRTWRSAGKSEEALHNCSASSLFGYVRCFFQASLFIRCCRKLQDQKIAEARLKRCVILEVLLPVKAFA